MRCALVAVVVAAAARAADASNPLEAGQRGQWWLKNHPSKQDDAPSIGLHQTVKKGGKAAKEKKEKASKEVPTSDVRYDNMPESKAKKPNSNQHSLLATAPADSSTAKHDARVAAKAAKDAAAEAKMLADEAAKEMDEAKRAYAEAESAASQWKAQQTTPTEQPQQQEIGPDSTMASSSAEQPQQQADTVPPQQQQEPQQQEQPLQQAVAVPQQQQQQQQQAEKQLSQNKANEADEADEADVAPAEGSSDDTSETEEMVAASAAMAAKVTRESTKAEAMTNAEAVTIDLDKSQQAQGSPAAAQNVTDQNATGVESRNLVKLVGDSILAIKGALNYSSGQRRYIEREMNLLNDAEALLALARSELPGLDGDSLLPPVATALVSTPATPDEKNEYAQARWQRRSCFRALSSWGCRSRALRSSSATRRRASRRSARRCRCASPASSSSVPRRPRRRRISSRPTLRPPLSSIWTRTLRPPLSSIWTRTLRPPLSSIWTRTSSRLQRPPRPKPPPQPPSPAFTRSLCRL